MKKYVIGLSIVIVFVIIVVCIYKIILGFNNIFLVINSAVKCAETKYPNNEFYVSGLSRTGENYNVTLSVKNNNAIKLGCYVKKEKMENGYYRSDIWFTSNIEYLTKQLE